MSDKESPKPPQDAGERHIDLSEGRKGMIVMPVAVAPMIDITNQAPTGLPTTQEAKPASETPPTTK